MATVIKLNLENIEYPLYKVKCKNCKKKYKSKILAPNKKYKCPYCNFETSELLLTKKAIKNLLPI